MARRLGSLVVAVLAVACSSSSSGDDKASSGGPASDASVFGDGSSSTSAWSEGTALPIAKQEVAVVTIDGKVYVIGGFDAAGAIVSDVDRFDVATQAWSAAARIPEPLHHINAVVVDGKIWITGALRGPSFEAAGVVLVYDPPLDRWTAKGSMPSGSQRGSSMVGAIGTTIYVAGGYRNNGAVSDVSAYDTATDSWTSLPPLADARDHGVGAVVSGVFFAIGGRKAELNAHTTRVDAFDPASGQWSPRAPMPTSRAGCAAAVAKGRVVVAGGEGNPASAVGVFSEVEAYDPTTDTWAKLAPMRTPRHGTGGAALGDVVFVPGGGTVQGLAATQVVESLTF